MSDSRILAEQHHWWCDPGHGGAVLTNFSSLDLNLSACAKLVSRCIWNNYPVQKEQVDTDESENLHSILGAARKNIADGFGDYRQFRITV